MIRRLCIFILALAVLPLFITEPAAQESTARQVEVRLVALSPGYMRPMSATAARIGTVDGIDSVEMLGYAGDMARYRVTTSLDDAGIATAFQMTLVSTGDGTLTLAAEESARAKHAEARGILTQIAAAIMAQPKPSWRRQGEALFESTMNLKQRLERLGLSTELLRGTSYKPDQFHIDEQWQGSGGTYKIWAGDSWEGMYVPSDDWYLDTPDEERETKAPRADSNFVGVRVYRSPYSNSMTWVDLEGLLLTGFEGDRDDTNAAGDLYVKLGADYMIKLLKAVGTLRVQKPGDKISNLPEGRGWSILQAFNYDEALQVDTPHYNIEDFNLAWRDDDGRYIATLRAHYPAHPFYLEAELDSAALIETYKARAKAEDLNLETIEDVELGDAIKWVVAAEESAEVFERRRTQAKTTFEKIRAALMEMSKTTPLTELCGTLEEVAERIGIKLDESNEFKAVEYAIRPQLLGDVELSVGTVRSGGRYWMLLNAKTGKLIRSNL